MRLKRRVNQDVVKFMRAVGLGGPKLVAQIGFTEWTVGDKLRHPRFLGLREDKRPEEIVRER